MSKLEVKRVEKVTLEDIERTYRGKTGCACGCGGEYYDIDNSEHLAEITKHLKYVNSKIAEAGFFGNGVELNNPAYTKVTRLYFKEGVRFYKDDYQTVDRITVKEGE